MTSSLVRDLLEAVTIFLGIAVVVLPIQWLLGVLEGEACRADRHGRRCVHDKDHPGSHRDVLGNYWND